MRRSLAHAQNKYRCAMCIYDWSISRAHRIYLWIFFSYQVSHSFLLFSENKFLEGMQNGPSGSRGKYTIDILLQGRIGNFQTYYDRRRTTGLRDQGTVNR